jgi:hypothetical protein
MRANLRPRAAKYDNNWNQDVDETIRWSHLPQQPRISHETYSAGGRFFLLKLISDKSFILVELI